MEPREIDLKDHGSAAAARRHYRYKEQLCELCKEWERRDNQDRWRIRKNRSKLNLEG